jgi:photosystem II stability/assembly factor-like uncharacterized protein
MKNKILLLSLIFALSAGCDLFGGNNGAVGMIKTVDGGGVWQSRNKIANTTSTLSNLSVSEILLDPGNHEHLYMSSNTSGFWRSFNSGDDWSELLSKIAAYDFFLNPQDANNIFVSGTFGGHGKIVRTKNGGSTWEEIYNEASANNAVNTVTANPNNPYEVYAALDSGTIIKSIDGGTNWFVVNNLKGSVARLRFPKNSNGIYAFMPNNGLFKSTDGGLHWISITLQLTGTAEGSYLTQYVDRFYKLGLDDQTAGVIYLTSSKGLYRTLDDGKNWSRLELPVKSDSESPRAIASTRGGVVAYTSIGSTIYKTLNGGQSWQTQGFPSNNLVNKIVIDPVLQQIGYAGLTER